MENSIRNLIQSNRCDLLEHRVIFPKENINLPGPDFVSRVMMQSDRNPSVTLNLQTIFDYGRSARTGYLSILPVDQVIEHSSGSAIAPNPIYFDPANIAELALEGGCNAIGSSLGILGAISKQFAHRIPFIVKLNYKELLSFPNRYDQIPSAAVDQAFDLGAVAVVATIYFGSQ